MAKDGPVYEKYLVSRVDGRDTPGRDKENARYYVMDWVNDPYAWLAMLYYANIIEDKYPQLAVDIRKKLGENV